MLSTAQRVSTRTQDAPLTLAESPPRLLGFGDQAALWGNLGITLTIPVAAAFVLRPSPDLPPLSVVAAVTAVLVGTVLGTAVLALAAVPGAETGAPSMVLLRGLLGRRGSFVPTALNIAQCVGWAAVEILVIADGASNVAPAVPRTAYVIGAGVLATVLALWPLGFVRELRRYAVWVVLAATAYLFVVVLHKGVVAPTHGSWRSFWLAVDVVVALPISWGPLVADYSRHSRRSRDAFGGVLCGFGLAAIAYFLLGVLAVLAAPGTQADPVGALLAVPAGAVAVGILVLDEIDEAFANLYSTALSAQNLRPTLDRRGVAVVVGVVATCLALVTDMTRYEGFLFLIGSVFVPLLAAQLVDYFLTRRHWNVGPLAPGRPLMAIPWLLGFVTYQLLNPGTVSGWSDLWVFAQAALRLTPPVWLSASLTSFAVAAAATVLVGAIERRRAG